MNFTLHQLQVFLTITKFNSVTKAAEELHLTQPAVSIQLKRLQDQFEIPLTERIGRKFYITGFGLEVAESAQKILDESNRLKSTVNQYKGLLTGKITISIVSTGKYVMPFFLESFMKAHPFVELKIDVSNKLSVVESIKNNTSDFSLVSVLPENIEVESIELLENKLHMVGSSQFDDKNLEDLKSHTFIFREMGSATRQAMERFIGQQKISGFKRMELVSNEAVKQALNAKLGVSIMPLIGLKNELENKQLKIFPLKGLPITTYWNLIHAKGKQLSPAALALTDHIQKHKQEIIDEHFG
jgi:DNA-binding transcriptional LysR family regulator